jgi:sialate O-acetylesterase
MKRFAFAWALVATAWLLQAEVKLPAVFGDRMVLQRETQAAVWGWAAPGEKVSVAGSWGASAEATATAEGTWRVTLPTPAAGGPFTVTVKGAQDSLELKDVLSGEVWLCSGQSNMAMAVAGSKDAPAETAAATFPQIRLLTVTRLTANEPQKDCPVQAWTECSPTSVGAFSAAGYFFGRKLHQELKVPIGLINSSWGGTRIEAWTPWESQKADLQADREARDAQDKAYDPEKAKTEFEADKKAHDEWTKGGKQGKEPKRPRAPVQPRKDPNYPSNLFNAMVHPLAPFALRGAIWYQGEANAGRGKAYRGQMERLITSWRQLWGSDLAFYLVQLPNYMAPWQKPVEEGGWPDIRESFMNTAKEVPNTGMAITIDIGEEKDIHPKNKQDVGDRLARVALKQTYGKTGFAWSGPVFKACEFRDGKARVSFDTGGAALAVKGGGELVGFALMGPDGAVAKAQAVIEGADTVVVSAPEVPQPIMVYYAWANNPVGVNLANAEGLPASPFRFGTPPQAAPPAPAK